MLPKDVFYTYKLSYQRILYEYCAILSYPVDIFSFLLPRTLEKLLTQGKSQVVAVSQSFWHSSVICLNKSLSYDGWLVEWMVGIDVLNSFVTLASTHAILSYSVTLHLLPPLVFILPFFLYSLVLLSSQFNLLFFSLNTANEL